MLVGFHLPVPMVMVVVLSVMVMTMPVHLGSSLGLLRQTQKGSQCSSRGQSKVPTRPPIELHHVLG